MRGSAILLLIALSAVAQSGPDGYVTGTPWIGSSGIRETTAEIMERDEQIRARAAGMKIKPRFKSDSQNLAQDPESPDVERWPEEGVYGKKPISPNGPKISSAQTVGISFTGATLADTGAFPPDSMGAAGPSQFLVGVNGRIRTFDKRTGIADGVLDAGMDAFFSSVMTPPVSSNFTSDPRVRYDRLSGRWFVTIIDVPGGTGSSPNRVLIAVSGSGTITTNTVWTFFYFQHDLVSPTGDTGKFADYPTLGIDANALYIGVNVFGSRGQKSSFSNTSAFVVRKSSILGIGPIIVTVFRNLIPNGNNGGPYTPHGVDNYNPGATEGYFIGVNNRFLGRLELRRVSNPGGTPSISGNISITIPLNGATTTVPHLGNADGTAGYLDGLDYRLLAAHLRNGRLWTTANIAVDNSGSPSGTDSRMGVRWYELQGIATGQTPGVVQSGTLFEPSSANTTDQRSYWMGTIMVSGQGHAAVGFSAAGAREYANAGTVGRLAGDPPGTMRTPLLYTTSTTAYNPPGDPGGPEGRRWGDYSYTSLDPNDDMTMWTIQEFCDSVNSYGVGVAKLLAPPPATPSSCSPSALASGVNSVNVAVSGLSVNGSGFFDPGPGFPNRISVSVNGGGVTINSVTYTDPTDISINLTVATGAAGGSRTITVSNPDGQPATSSSGILTIIGGGTSNSPPVLATILNQTVNEQTPLAFTASATDPDGDGLTFSLDPGAVAGANINPTNGFFSWTPTEAQGPGSYTIVVRVTDDGSPPLSDAKTFAVTVSEVNRPPLLAAIPDQIVHAESTLVVAAMATDADIPANTLMFGLDAGAPVGANINPTNGVFTWTPTEAEVGQSNTVSVRVTDDGLPGLSDASTFSIVVVSRPVIESISLAGENLTINWSAIPGAKYRLQFKSDLNEPTWNDLPADVTADANVAEKMDSIAGIPQRFYRVVLLP